MSDNRTLHERLMHLLDTTGECWVGDLRADLGDAYGDVEQATLESLLGLDREGRYEATLEKMKRQWGEDEAARLALRMLMTIRAQMREARRGDDPT